MESNGLRNGMALYAIVAWTINDEENKARRARAK
jgi:hypothetical protein